jgi:hypothetical protein
MCDVEPQDPQSPAPFFSPGHYTTACNCSSGSCGCGRVMLTVDSPVFILLLLQGRQSFSLHNVKLAGSLSRAVVTLTFRWVWADIIFGCCHCGDTEVLSLW